MKVNMHNASLTISAVSPRQYPPAAVPEVAMAGRSNVGKSSCINKLLNRKSLARTSATPGKTATINFYNIDEKLFLVDLPGYGYAKVSRAEQEKWAVMINTYLETRPQLTGVLLLVDARHKPTAQDKAMFDWIRHRFGHVSVVATKCDKLAKTKVEEHLKLVSETLGMTEADTLFPFSSENGMGKENVWGHILALTGMETD